ncbi:hypothetical protein L873DRAFT_1774896 [Choiromyces venosus 120613-1]|uniref:Uncharacterized protein n=1 Tax=Choiromyces venosus 120613-1 TaxID=1336337 RepID=A0A3N4JAM0_9PEZI|nr:hypothetical protein L873DRAFT_1774896 [Choiromyces venosus 120613-1]
MICESDNVNIADAAQEFNVLEGDMRRKLKGHQMRSEGDMANRKIINVDKLRVYLYLNSLDEIGSTVQVSIISHCSNHIL